jgi:hypothetical protein
MGDLLNWLWLLPVGALALAAVRVATSKDAGRHPFFLLLIAATAATILFGNWASLALSVKFYARFWLVAYVAVWSLTALALTEACTRSLERYQRFGQIGRRIIHSVLILSGAISGGWFFIAPQELVSEFFQFFQTQGYIAQGSLAVLGLSIWCFASWAHLKLPVNSRRGMRILTIFCVGETALGVGVGVEWPSVAFYIGIAWTTICWVTLAALWQRQTDESWVDSSSLDQEQAASVLAEMEETNRGLAGALRRGRSRA